MIVIAIHNLTVADAQVHCKLWRNESKTLMESGAVSGPW